MFASWQSRYIWFVQEKKTKTKHKDHIQNLESSFKKQVDVFFKYCALYI